MEERRRDQLIESQNGRALGLTRTFGLRQSGGGRGSCLLSKQTPSSSLLPVLNQLIPTGLTSWASIPGLTVRPGPRERHPGLATIAVPERGHVPSRRIRRSWPGLLLPSTSSPPPCLYLLRFPDIAAGRPSRGRAGSSGARGSPPVPCWQLPKSTSRKFIYVHGPSIV
jgi:hypothetical protein